MGMDIVLSFGILLLLNVYKMEPLISNHYLLMDK